MKKISAVLLSLLLLGLCACGSGGGTTTNEEKPQYDDSLITETCSDEGSYTDGTGNGEAYSYHVPALVANSDDAETINSAIEDKFGSAVEENKKNMQDKLSLYIRGVSWKTYWHDSVVCLVIKAEYDASDYVDYGVYSYDFASNTAVTNAQLFDMAALTEDEFLTKAREEVGKAFDSANSEIKDSFDGYDDLRDWTLSDDNINADMMTYIDGDGALTVIAPIGVPAGSGWYYDNVIVSKP